jgi:HSP90 family molecular chaperone
MACTLAGFTARRTTRHRISAWAGSWCHVKGARMYRASGQAVPVRKRILELNPKHSLVTGLQQVHKNRSDDSSLVDTAELLTAQPFSPKAA